MTPRVSLALPVYNGEKFIAEAITSILAQDYSDFELIITDNNSTNSTAGICQEFASKDSRIKYFRNERNIGAGPNFNLAFGLASGTYFKWCAADDRLSSNYIGECVRLLDDRPDAVLVYGRTESIDQLGRIIPLIGSMSEGIEDANAAHRFRRVIREVGTCYEVFGMFRATRSGAPVCISLTTDRIAPCWLKRPCLESSCWRRRRFSITASIRLVRSISTRRRGACGTRRASRAAGRWNTAICCAILSALAGNTVTLHRRANRSVWSPAGLSPRFRYPVISWNWAAACFRIRNTRS